MSKANQIRVPSKDDLSQLEHYSNLLHLFHHRNQNQHRRSIWYRHFALFRRQLTALRADYTTLSAAPTTAVERTRLKALTPGLHTRISQRLTYWQDVLAARWMRAFSQVVADSRFSVLGLVMLGVLGGVCKIVGVVEGLEAEGQAEIERVLEEFGKEAWGDDDGFGEAIVRGASDEGKAISRAEEGEPVARDDQGEVVARRDDDEDDDKMLLDDGRARELVDHTSASAPTSALDESERKEPRKMKVAQKRSPSPAKKSKTKPSSTKKRSTEDKTKSIKKKRKKGGDAIDDLFSGW